MKHTLRTDIAAQSKEHLETLLFNMLNDMENESKKYIEEYSKNNDKIEFHAYASGMLTHFNRMKVKLAMHRYSKNKFDVNT